MTPPPATPQKVKKEGFKAETKCKKISGVRFPNEIATPTRVRCGGDPGILQEGSRGRSLGCRPSASHVDSLPLPPPGRTSSRRPLHAGRTGAQGRRPPPTLPRPGAGRRAEVASAPKEMANRKCPYCNAETVQVPTPRASRAPGRRPEEPRERAGVASPHPGPAPQVHAGRAWRLLGTTYRGPAGPARAGSGLHAARVPLRWEPERRRGAGSPGS